ncbi:MAG: ATP-binding cassette domain-containing protein, partial [Chloroflexi bacterium]|nr:ATP-binding cassette domain-containing protein [Chloroflexota bacterium]
DRDIAMVFQNYALYPHMKVYDNMAFGLKMRGYAKDQIQRQVQQAADILGLADLLERKVQQLSGGQRQRVALGRAIVREPAVFLMDEPLSNLDAKLRTQTRTELIRLHQRLAATVLSVTHDQVAAMSMATRIAIMNRAVLQQVDAPQRIYDFPANTFVAGFIGTPPMNLLPATLERHAGALTVAVGNERFPLPPRQAQLAERAGSSGGRVILGIRPEHLRLAHAEGAGEAVIEVVEPLGSETLVTVRIGDTEATARIMGAAPFRMGEAVTVQFDHDYLHVFDADSGVNLALTADAAGVR